VTNVDHARKMTKMCQHRKNAVANILCRISEPNRYRCGLGANGSGKPCTVGSFFWTMVMVVVCE
jgi:hypothetical protein